MKNILTKRLFLLILMNIVLISSIGCSRSEESIVISDAPLTTEQKLEDFEYMYNLLKDNYPFFEVNKRVHGIDWLSNKEDYIERVKNTKNDHEFMNELNYILGDLNDGHTNVIPIDSFKWYYYLYTDSSYKGLKPWADVLKDKRVLHRYEFDESQADTVESEAYFGNRFPAYKTDILLPGEVAYLYIKSMDGNRVEEDGKEIRKFYEEIKDFKKLIIDIRGNGGGSDMYWMKNVIEPLAKEPLTAKNYIFIRGEYNKPFYKARGISLKPIDRINESILDEMPSEIVDDFDSYYLSSRRIKPNDPIDFKGDIYLLVDGIVYSSAESFAAFCKDTGFATLVGESTGGGGAGIDPFLFYLPNSGIVIRYSNALSLNGDFTINDEVKTIPHVEVPSRRITPDNFKYDKAVQYVINH